MSKEQKIAEAYRMIHDLEEAGMGLTDWEGEFILGLTEQLEREEWISDKQDSTLCRIYEERMPGLPGILKRRPR